MVTLKNLSKRFGSIVAVEDLSLEIPEGEIFGLLGPNGAGKTTTVSLAVGILQPDSGSIDLARLGPPSSSNVRAMIGVAPQAVALYGNLSGEENLRFFGRLQGLRGRRLTERVQWALDLVQLEDRRRHRVKTYSGGMKRRLNLAVALIHDPPILFLDEPTVGVDPQSRNFIFENIGHMRESGKTIVYTTHYMEEAERLCDRVGIMDHGRLLALDTVENLITAHGGKSVIVAEDAEGEVRIETDDPLGDLAKLKIRRRLVRLRVERPDLETVFLKLTGRHLRDN
ncbi:MAG TPA: ABC transporter ATP-binding protein [bacterium]|nr:ABC transporter ATP-binding protein [bacterium]